METIKLQDGRVIECKDTIFHTAYVHLGFMDRVRVLFIGKLRVESEIYCGELPEVKGSIAKTYCNRIFNSYRRAFISKKQTGGWESVTN